jgi:hypothetical protein
VRWQCGSSAAEAGVAVGVDLGGWSSSEHLAQGTIPVLSTVVFSNGLSSRIRIDRDLQDCNNRHGLCQLDDTPPPPYFTCTASSKILLPPPLTSLSLPPYTHTQPHHCSIVLRVADGATVSIAYGSGDPEPVATLSQVEMLSTNLNELTALLQLTRDEAASRGASLNDLSATVSELVGGTPPSPPPPPTAV